jgi:hypothetical protein
MMKKAWFLKVLGICLYVCASLFLFTTHSSGQLPYYPYGYQQPYTPYGYQQPYNPYSYQQFYNPYGYQQFYNPYGYQQSYNPYGYQQSYYPYGYQQSYYPTPISGDYPFYSSGLGYNSGFGQLWPLNPWYSSFQYASPWSYWESSSLDNYNLPCTGLYGKPAIYLYPQEDTYIWVDLAIDGQFTQTIPSYDDGWYVLAKPDGTLFDMRDGYDQDKFYDYLFWEAETDLGKLELPDQGWIVAKGDLEGWFSANLPLLGLNEKEKAQFMEYWLERLSESAYYELKLLSSEFLAEHATLIITPQPDTLIRVIFSFRPMDEPKALEAPEIETPQREGFVVLEWGGILAE